MFDIGANLTHSALRPKFATLLDCAWRSGISDISITAAHPDCTGIALDMIREAHTPIALSTTTGLHPHNADRFNHALLVQLEHYAQKPEVAAIGETGLDYFRMLAEAKKQRTSFCAHLRLAAEYGKPVFLHQRDAHQDFIAILREFRPQLSRVVVHCFTDTKDVLHQYLELDCYIGITGWINDVKRGQGLRQAVADIPQDRLLIETDAPYLLPPEAKHTDWLQSLDAQTVAITRTMGRNNLPHMLPLVLAKVCECRDQDPHSLAQITTCNARRFFGGNHVRT